LRHRGREEEGWNQKGHIPKFTLAKLSYPTSTHARLWVSAVKRGRFGRPPVGRETKNFATNVMEMKDMNMEGGFIGTKRTQIHPYYSQELSDLKFYPDPSSPPPLLLFRP